MSARGLGLTLLWLRQHRHMNLDGCYFGTTFPHLFLHMYGDQQPALPTEQYVPRIYGFKVGPAFASAQACGTCSPACLLLAVPLPPAVVHPAALRRLQKGPLE